MPPPPPPPSVTTHTHTCTCKKLMLLGLRISNDICGEIYLSDFIKTWPLGFRLAQTGQSGVQKSRGLAVLVGTAG